METSEKILEEYRIQLLYTKHKGNLIQYVLPIDSLDELEEFYVNALVRKDMLEKILEKSKDQKIAEEILFIKSDIHPIESFLGIHSHDECLENIH